MLCLLPIDRLPRSVGLLLQCPQLKHDGQASCPQPPLSCQIPPGRKEVRTGLFAPPHHPADLLANSPFQAPTLMETLYIPPCAHPKYNHPPFPPRPRCATCTMDEIQRIPWRIDEDNRTDIAREVQAPREERGRDEHSRFRFLRAGFITTRQSRQGGFIGMCRQERCEFALFPP